MKIAMFLVVFNKSILPIITILTIALIYNRLFKPDIKEITDVALNVFAPIMVFYSVLNNRITLNSLAKPFLFMSILTGVLFIASFTVSTLLRLEDDEKRSLILSSSMINVGNFGLPLIYFSYGKAAIPYSMIYFVIFNIPLITVAIYLSGKESNPFNAIKNMVKMPIFHGFLVGIIFVETGVHLPSSVMKGFSLMNSGAIALLVFILGLQLSNIKVKMKFAGIIGTAVIIRLLLSPILGWEITSLLDIKGLERCVSIVQTSTPSAILPLMYMIKFGRKSDLMAAIILSTTVISGITLPILIGILQNIQ